MQSPSEGAGMSFVLPQVMSMDEYGTVSKQGKLLSCSVIDSGCNKLIVIIELKTNLTVHFAVTHGCSFG